MNYIIIYLEVKHLLNFLTKEDKGDLLDALIEYGETKQLPECNQNVLNVFNYLKPKLDAQREKMELKAEIARKNGVAGGRPPKGKKPRKTECKLKETKSVIDDGFESFWNLYGKKISRPDAEKKFKAALKKDTFENIMAGLQKYIAARSTDSQYWKNPSTWLNQECWKDEYYPKQTETLEVDKWSKY